MYVEIQRIAYGDRTNLIVGRGERAVNCQVGSAGRPLLSELESAHLIRGNHSAFRGSGLLWHEDVASDNSAGQRAIRPAMMMIRTNAMPTKATAEL